MRYENLYDDFIDLFPDDCHEIQKIAEAASAETSDGMHIMFGKVVVPFLLELLNGNKDSKLKVAFSFFEKMAMTNETEISEVLEFTVLEDLVSGGKGVLEKCKPYMGKRTLESCAHVEKYLL